MPSNTFTLISSVTVGSGGASSIDFTSIPATYTDLKLVYTARNKTSSVSEGVILSFNSNTSNYSAIYLDNTNGGTPRSGSAARYAGVDVASNQTASTFANNEIYIPNYVGSTYKSYSVDSVTENNATAAYLTLIAGLWSNTSAITSISLTLNSDSFAQYSTAYLYGIKNS